MRPFWIKEFFTKTKILLLDHHSHELKQIENWFANKKKIPQFTTIMYPLCCKIALTSVTPYVAVSKKGHVSIVLRTSLHTSLCIHKSYFSFCICMLFVWSSITHAHNLSHMLPWNTFSPSSLCALAKSNIGSTADSGIGWLSLWRYDPMVILWCTCHKSSLHHSIPAWWKLTEQLLPWYATQELEEINAPKLNNLGEKNDVDAQIYDACLCVNVCAC